MRFYVYKLIDPRNGEAFYVGKGTGRRMYHHVAEARKGALKGNLPKLERIRSILADGREPRASIVQRFDSEQEALDYEALLIATLPGLTNILARGGGGWSITAEEYNRRQKAKMAEWMQAQVESLKAHIATWDAWMSEGRGVTFIGVKNGDELAREYVQIVRQLTAA